VVGNPVKPSRKPEKPKKPKDLGDMAPVPEALTPGISPRSLGFLGFSGFLDGFTGLPTTDLWVFLVFLVFSKDSLGYRAMALVLSSVWGLLDVGMSATPCLSPSYSTHICVWDPELG